MSNFDQKDQNVHTQINTAIQQLILLTLPTADLLNEKSLESIKSRIKKLDDLDNINEIINSLSQILQQALDKEQTTAYVNSIATVYKIIKPVTSDYLRQPNKVLPYATIINNLLLRLAEFFSENNCFSLYGKDVTYSDKSSQTPIYPLMPGTIYPQIRNLSTNNLYFVPPSPPKLRVLSLDYLSDILRADPLFKDRLGSDGQVLIKRKSEINRKPIESTRNKILKVIGFEHSMKYTEETTYTGILYYQRPIPSVTGRIYFDDQYFISIEDEHQIKIPPQTFSNFYYGFVLDLLYYIHSLQIEADSNYKTISFMDRALKNSQNKPRSN